MDLREAHQVLGIDETVEANAARRAYLKLLKKHRPESDPEGFQRIRAAHELVASHRSMFGRAPAAGVYSVEPEQALGRLSAEVLPADLPLANPEPSPESALTSSQVATEQELEAAQESGHDDAILFSVFLSAGDLERAGPAAVRALENEQSSGISGYRLIELLFALEASGSERGGPLLFEKINEHIARRLDEPELFGNCIPSWILVSEYFSARPHLSQAGRVFVGDVCRHLDWDAAPNLAMNWRPGKSMTRAQVMSPIRDVLSSRASTLFSVLFPSAASEPKVVVPRATSSSSGIHWWAITLLVFGVFRILRGCGFDGLPSFVPTSESVEIKTDQLERRTPLDEKRDAASSNAEIPDTDSVSRIASASSSPGLDGWFALRETAVASFHRASLESDCERMEGALADLGWYQRRAPESEKEKAAAENDGLRDQYVGQCETESENEQK